MTSFEGLPPQPRAREILDAVLARPGHAYLFAGPEGSAKRVYAEAFAAELLGCDLHRITTRTHPDLFVLEPEGSGILMDDARRMRHDLHLRPFESNRRVYLILDAHLLRDDSANSLLKSLEDPPAYAVFVLVSDHVGRMLPTILSRVATVPFQRFTLAQLEAEVSDTAAARAALGSLTRARELATDAAAAERRLDYRRLAHDSATDPAFDPAVAAATVMAAAATRAKRESAEVARELQTMLQSVDDPKQERALRKRFEERGKRAARRAEWDELRLAVDTVGLWHRDQLAAAVGANDTMLDSETVGGAPDARAGDAAGSVAALAVVLDARRSLELNVHPGLALEALFHRLGSVPGDRVESAN
jgi:DNA polymerase III subunit delta'